MKRGCAIERMQQIWTLEDVWRLAPDMQAKRVARRLIAVKYWDGLGQDEGYLWGEYPSSGTKPYQVKIALNEQLLACSCPSHKRPCKHSLALLGLWAVNSAHFSVNEPPDWMARWLRERKKRAARKSQPPKPPDPVAQAKRQKQRLMKVQAGMDELSLWLQDLVRNGLGVSQLNAYQFWDKVAARMVDAQAPGAARLLHRMGGLPASGGGWVNVMLGDVAKLHLMTQGFQRYDELPELTQITLRTAAGWRVKRNELLDAPRVRDIWVVVGQDFTEEDRLKIQHTWLWGIDSNRPMLWLDYAYGHDLFDRSLPAGIQLEAEVVFYPSHRPLRGFVVTRLSDPTPLTTLPGADSILSGLASYSRAVAGNPWLERYPLMLANVTPVLEDEDWFIQDAEHRIGVSKRFSEQWLLPAISGGNPIALFGEWDGTTFLPLSAEAEGRWVDLVSLRRSRGR